MRQIAAAWAAQTAIVSGSLTAGWPASLLQAAGSSACPRLCSASVSSNWCCAILSFFLLVVFLLALFFFHQPFFNKAKEKKKVENSSKQHEIKRTKKTVEKRWIKEKMLQSSRHTSHDSMLKNISLAIKLSSKFGC